MRRSTHRGGARDRLRRQRRRRRALAGAAVIVLVAGVLLAVLGTLSHTSPREGHVSAARVPVVPTHPVLARRPARDPAPPPLQAAGTRPPATPAEAQLVAALNRALKPAGPDTGVLVDDLSARRVLYARRAGVARPPASVEKLWTTVAIMLRLGPGTRMRTTLLGTGSARHGVWHGNLYLRGGGDPTFGDQQFNTFWNGGYGPTPNEIASQLRARGIRAVTGRVYADESLFDRRRGGLETAYSADVGDFGGQLSALTYDHGTTLRGWNPATFAAHELVLTLRGGGIRARAATHDARTPRGAHVLATVVSPPMSVMARLMDVPSDDLFAELFTKMLGVRFGPAGTIAAGAHVISTTIAHAYGLHPRIFDGSGLSRGDRSSPLQIVQLLRAVWGTPAGRELAASLPTVGREGTVHYIGVKTRAAGRCVAKTGTLDYVTNLAGYCSARNGHRLAFAAFIDGPGNAAADVLEGRIIGDIARY